MSIRSEASRSIELLSLNKLIGVAYKQYHFLFFKILKEKKLEIDSMEMELKPGKFLFN